MESADQTNSKKASVEWKFGVLWALASTIGVAAGAPATYGIVFVAFVLSFGRGATEVAAIALLLSAFPVFGTLLGTAQWLVMRKKLPVSGIAWILASAGGIFIFLGVTQWIILRRHVSQAGWWVLANTVAIAQLIVSLFLLSESEPDLGAVLRWMTLLLSPIIFGAITGAALVWLLRQPARAS